MIMDCSTLNRRIKDPKNVDSSLEEPIKVGKRRRQRRSNVFFVAAASASLVFVSITSLLSASATNRRSIQVIHKQNEEHCVIHIHGVHHSGTGFTRQAVFHSLGGDSMASMHKNTSTPEDEGQFLQDVYPINGIRRENPPMCGLSTSHDVKTVGRIYYCPELVPMMANETNAKERLHEQWSRFWNMSKPFLIQKTPSMDVLLFERLKIYPTMHLIVMRHPFAWDTELRQHYLPFIHDPLFFPICMAQYMDIFTRSTLQQ